MASPSYDVTVIGAGPGGYVAAIRSSQLGLRTAIVEKDDRLGGTCLLRGCIPTKALLESAHLFEKMKASTKWGIQTTGVTLDFAGVQKARERAVAANSKGVSFLMRKNKIDVHSGHGRLAGRGRVSVTAKDGKLTTLETKNVILATGSVCKDFPGISIDHRAILNSDDILEIDRLPASLIVMGAGAVGTEFASCFAAFGTKVTLVEYMERILPFEDADISAELEKQLKRRGIDVRTSSSVSNVERTAGGVRVQIATREGTRRDALEAEALLVAVGRAPVTRDLGLDGTGVKIAQRGTIEVDEFCRTGEANVFAIGDIVPTPWLAHVASHQGTMVAELIAGRHPHPLQVDQVPSCTYCDPEVASVGLTQARAVEKGYDVRTGTFPFVASGKARIMGEDHGFVKFVAEKRYNQLLGVHIIGPKATELISEIVLGLGLEATVEDLVHAIHPHPTLAEAIGEAAAATLNGAALNA